MSRMAWARSAGSSAGLGHGALAYSLGWPVALSRLPARGTEACGPKSAHNRFNRFSFRNSFE
jgi:hypothetical protein